MIENSHSEGLSLKLIVNDPSTQSVLVSAVVDGWDRGKLQRTDKEDVWAETWEAYNRVVTGNGLDPNRSKVPSELTYTMVTNGTKALKALLFPAEEDFFAISAIKSDKPDKTNSLVMTKYIQHIFEQMQLLQQIEMGIIHAYVTGCAAFKIYWKQDTITTYEEEGEGYQGYQVPVYNAPYVEHIPVQDFVVYPAVGDINKTLCIHRCIKPYSDVAQNPSYGNLEKLTPSMSTKPSMDIDSFVSRINQSSRITNVDEYAQDGVELLEAWGDFNIDGTVYRNFVATVASRKVLLRFEPNTNPDGLKPFIFYTKNRVPGQIYGVGDAEAALPLHKMHQFLNNTMLDEIKLKLTPPMGYVDDGVFNPLVSHIRPGAKWKVANKDSVFPITQNLQVDVGFAELAALKCTYEEMTGVSRYTKGTDSTAKYVTATATDEIAGNTQTNFTEAAKDFSKNVLVPIVKSVYQLIRAYGSPQEISEYTGVSQEELAVYMVPLSESSINITGIDTAIRKAQYAQAIERFMTGVSRTPGAVLVNWYEMYRVLGEALKINNPEDLLIDEKIASIIQNKMGMDTLQLPPPAQLAAVAQYMGFIPPDFVPPMQPPPGSPTEKPESGPANKE